MARDLSTFPAELLDRICVVLERSDLRNVRLVSRMLDGVAQRILFQTVFLKIHLRSFERLQHISRHEKLSKYVKIINYDGRTLMNVEGMPAFEAWLENTAGDGLGLGWGPIRKQFFAQFTRPQFKKYPSDYCH